MATSQARSDATNQQLLIPFALERAPIRRLLVIDIAHDPILRAIEPQLLELDDGTTTVVVIAYRRDGYVELYSQHGVKVDPSGYRLDRGLLGPYSTSFEHATFAVTPAGLQLDVVFTAVDGRKIELHIHENLPDGRDHFPALAPVGGSFNTPEFFPLFWLPAMSFLPVHCTDTNVRIEGLPRAIRRLPIPFGGRRCLFARYDPDVAIWQVNPSRISQSARVFCTDAATQVLGNMEVDVAGSGEDLAIETIRVRDGVHTSSIAFEPGLPDLARLPDSRLPCGTAAFSAGGVVQLHADYAIRRTGGHVELSLDNVSPWRSHARRPLLALLFRLPLFRRWPTTYTWHATLDLADAHLTAACRLDPILNQMQVAVGTSCRATTSRMQRRSWVIG